MSTQNLTDYEKMKKVLETLGELASFEELAIYFMQVNFADFSSIRIQQFMDSVSKNVLHPKLIGLERVRAVSSERALYLKTYLDGDMYTTKEAAIEHIPIQAKNAQAIIDVCNNVDNKPLTLM